MNKNIENYRNAVDQIRVDDNLKNKVLEKSKEKSKNKSIFYLRYAVCFATVVIVAVIGIGFYNKKDKTIKLEKNLEIVTENKEKLLSNYNIKRFKNSEELRSVIEKYQEENGIEEKRGTNEEIQLEDSVKSAVTEGASNNEETLDYSKTNNQVENVDEADIVKTDGKNIYYCQNSRVYILDNDLNQKAIIENEGEFSPYQIFLNGKNLVIFGTIYKNTTEIRNIGDEITKDSFVEREDIAVSYKPKTVAKIYDISNVEEPKLKREISVDGRYIDGRMIKNNIYFVSTYYLSLYEKVENLEDSDILPSYKDSAISDKNKTIEANRIVCFAENSEEELEYSIVVGFSLDNNEETKVETFLGNSNEIYVSENNLYIISKNYSRYWSIKDSTIYRFSLKNGDVLASGSVKVDGSLKNQFSIDEYDGKLRVATTVNVNNFEIDEKLDLMGAPVEKYENRILIFNEDLEKIGEIENLIEDEEIYSVRFIGNVGYIVTFKEIDPLWVVDLSDPTNPTVKGELEIPGYSSYLHPWDETHIIGFGCNVEDNGYGGLRNDTIKLSMFDISDLENPKEVFNISFDHKNAYSNVFEDHKTLFINKVKNLIGFPVNWFSNVNDYNSTGLILYRVDLENNKFEEISNLTSKGYGYVQRGIYIGDYIYCLYTDRIEKYDINTFEEIKRIEIDDSVSSVRNILK